MKKKNLILAIGDGMGIHQMSLGRLHGYGPKGKKKVYEQKLFMDGLELLAMQSTSSNNSIVTDSAAAGTALAVGQRVDNKQIGVPASKGKKRLPSLTDELKDKGYNIAIVTTTRITHATPAAFYSHVEHRDLEIDIAKQIESSKVDILIGGGKNVTNRDPKSGEKTEAKIQACTGKLKVLTTYASLMNSLKNPSRGKIIAALADSHLPYEIDRKAKTEKSLNDLVQAVMDHLEKQGKPYCLIIESGRIDHACHGHDAGTVAKEVLHFDTVLKNISDRIKKKQTWLVVTADHSCGGPVITEKVTKNIGRLRNQSESHRVIFDNLKKTVGDDRDIMHLSTLVAHLRDKYGSEESLLLEFFLENGARKKHKLGKYQKRTLIGHWLSLQAGIDHLSIDLLNEINDEYGLTFGHDGTDVPVMANMEICLPPRIENYQLKDYILECKKFTS